VNFDDLLSRCLPDHDALTDFAFLIEDGRFIAIARLARDIVPHADVYKSWYELLYKSMCACTTFDKVQKDAAVVLIAEHLYRHSVVTDHEINFVALCILLEGLAGRSVLTQAG
jgi:hypothetical protein